MTNYEIKLDGYRTEVVCAGGETRARGKSLKKLRAVATNGISYGEMTRSKSFGQNLLRSKAVFYAATVFVLLSPVCGCVLVGGYRSGSGFFVWPGTLGVVVVALLLLFVLRRR
jgi:hypothetical protein